MNWLLICVLGILAVNLAEGYFKGFLRVAYSMVAGLLILIAVTLLTPPVANLLTEYTRIDENIEQACADKVHEIVLAEKAKQEGAAASELKIQLPQVIVDKLLDADTALDNYLEGSGVYDAVAKRATELAMRGIASALVFVVAVIISILLTVALDLVSKLPLIGTANRTLGLLVGAVKGIFMVWAAFAVIAMASSTSWGMTLNGLIYDSAPLLWLYKINPILRLLVISF
ncbi:MAG: CvpA family protein [Agathobacter sp.]|nr:CvpA family protein [Agathobacter sp.]